MVAILEEGEVIFFNTITMKKELPPKYWILNEDLYGAEIALGVNCTAKEFQSFLAKKYKDYQLFPINSNWQGYGGRITNSKNEGMGYCLWLKRFNWTIEEQGTAVHEIFHVVNRILSDRGIYDSRVDEELINDEAYAYYLSYWFEEIWTKLKLYHEKIVARKKRKKSKKKRATKKP